ncbi:MAG: acyl-CoA thioesterase [Planctomycetota bacterium]
MEPRHVSRIRVRYAETDRMGVVYNANHFVYYEVGRSDLMRSLGIRYADLEAEGYVLFVVEAHARFRGRVTYDDEVLVETRITLPGKTKVRFDYTLTHAEGGAVLSEGYTLHAFCTPEGKAIRIPEKVREACEGIQSAGNGAE